jgi:hypothetical protein
MYNVGDVYYGIAVKRIGPILVIIDIKLKTIS